jgi:branched-chain amino acid transport system permease protein
VAERHVLPLVVREGSPAHRVYVVVPWVVAAAVLVYIPLATNVGFAPGSVDEPGRIGQINQVIAFAVAILGLNLVIGFSGQLSLGQSAFVGLGAYTTVILVADHGWDIVATLPASAAVCFVVGLLIGVPASRIKGPYLAVATLAMAYVFPVLVVRFEWLTGGVNGKGPPRGRVDLRPPSWMPFADDGRLAQPLWVYCILVVVATVLFLLARNFLRSRPGRALLAVRDNPAGATSSGIRQVTYLAMAFAMSAVYGGLAGSMLMINRPFASDVQFGTRQAIFLVVGLVVGGHRRDRRRDRLLLRAVLRVGVALRPEWDAARGAPAGHAVRRLVAARWGDRRRSRLRDRPAAVDVPAPRRVHQRRAPGSGSSRARGAAPEVAP